MLILEREHPEPTELPAITASAARPASCSNASLGSPIASLPDAHETDALTGAEDVTSLFLESTA
jgi:hypothetical protein